ncbi:hypothetical protein CDL62_10845 [Alkalitalea saponilacus]|uniref:Por secretion system C-terminal sorting domain-containing protein n=2 Tax=Alkalitalea saponilacus TaxID=889453 RepID=A0A1T5BT87_9BACT|nr:hypothetical protein CDL62_10845 [Alkalitalea saponilacus]SKB50445.1 Por secretion system C-terminal sorting domain-containing protein [Alkalitalea saponilacus]
MNSDTKKRIIMRRNLPITIILLFVTLHFSYSDVRQTITRWTFDGITEPIIGEGSASLIGGTEQHSVEAENGWRFINFPEQQQNSGTAGAQFMISTEGYQNIHLEFEHRSSGTASRWAQFEYTTDGGDTWQIYGNNSGGLFPRDTFYPFSMDLSGVEAANDNPGFGVRIVSIFSPVEFNPGEPDQDFDANTAYQRARDEGGNEYSPEGNWRLRDVNFTGEVITPNNHQVFTRWTFEGNTDPSIGEGVAQLIGGTSEHSVDSESGWRFDNFPIQGAASGTAGASFMVSTEGYENIIINFEQRASGTASRWAQFEYSTDGGVSWQTYGNNDGGLAPRDIFHPFMIDLSEVSDANDNPDFAIRIVSIFSPEPFNPGVPDLDLGANLNYHRARDFDDGGSEYSPEGNWRLRNVAFSGEIILYPNPTALKIEAVNENNPVFADQPFSLKVGIYNADGKPSAAEADTEVTLELVSGNGTLTGTITGTIADGLQNTIITGILYDEAEEFEIRANADGLEASQGINIIANSYLRNLVLTYNMPGGGTVIGSGEFQADAEVVAEALPLYGFNFIRWVDHENNEVSTNTEFTFTMPDNDVTLTAIFEPELGEDIIHYWHFNELPGGILTEVVADYSAFESGIITYPGTGDGYMDFFDNGSEYNLQMDADVGTALRVRNPAISRELIIDAPSSGFTNLHLTFEVHRSNNGPTQQNLHYSIDQGASWVPIALGYEIETDYHVISFPLSAYAETENNANLQFRILFIGENNTGDAGNNRFDNILVSGNLIDGYTSTEQMELNHDSKPYPNPAKDYIHVNIAKDNSIITLKNMSGQEVYRKRVHQGDHRIELNGISGGFYLLQISNPTDHEMVIHKVLVK